MSGADSQANQRLGWAARGLVALLLTGPPLFEEQA